MSERDTFWPVECEAGEPDLMVCMSCLGEVFKRKVPMPDCPACHGVSTYEAFTLEAIRDWGTEQLIQQAEKADVEVEQPMPPAPEPGVELSTE